MSLDDDPTLKTLRQIRREVDDELEHHLEELTRELTARGWTPAEARSEAERRFGDRLRHRQACERIQRGRRSALARRHWWTGVGLDTRQALRSVWRSPTHSIVAVATLALCLGAATLIFGLVDGVLLRPLAFPEPERLVAVWQLSRDDGDHEFVSPANFIDWRERSTSFDGLAAYEDGRATLTDLGEPVRVDIARVRSDYFSVFGVDPARGRWLTEGDVRDRAAVAVVSHGFWQSFFAGREDVLDETLVLDGVAHRIVGVQPPGFDPPQDAVVWTPLVFDFDVEGSRGAQYLRVVARLAEERSFGDALAEVDAVARQLETEHPDHLENRGIDLVPLHQSLVADSQRPLRILSVAVALVLLLGVANVTALGLAQGQLRLPEHALRRAIGAGRRRLLRQLTLEHLVLTVSGAALGLLIAGVGLQVAKRLLPFDLPRLDGVAIGPRAALFALALAATTALIMGLWQTAQSGRSQLSGVLRGARAGLAVGRSRMGIVAVEIALAVVLLSGAGLLLRSFTALTEVDPGFETEHVLTFRLGLPRQDYSESSWPETFGRLEDALASDARVRNAGVAAWIPFESGWFFSYRIAGAMAEEDARAPSCAFRPVSAGYFEALEIPVLSGRLFDLTDRAGSSPVIVVNAAFERANFGDDSALGARVAVGYGSDEPIERTVIGVVADVDQFRLGSGAAPTVYVPHRQVPFSSMTAVVRTLGAPEDVGPLVREAVAQIDDRLAIERLESIEQRIGTSLQSRRFVATLITLFSGLAVLIAFVGLYALLAQQVASRRQELGVRLAMGAQRLDVAGWVLRRVLRLAVPGVAVGLLGAVAVGQLLERQLFEVGPRDPVALLGASLSLLVVGVLAALLPAWRATRLDPTRVLKL